MVFPVAIQQACFIQPLVDQLAIAKEGNENELAVKVSSFAEILFNIMQESWYDSIRYDGIALGG